MQVDNGKIVMTSKDVDLLKSILRDILSEISMSNTSYEVDYGGEIRNGIDNLLRPTAPDFPEDDCDDLEYELERLERKNNDLRVENRDLKGKIKELEANNLRNFTISSLNDTSEYYKDIRNYCKELEDRLKKYEEVGSE